MNAKWKGPLFIRKLNGCDLLVHTFLMSFVQLIDELNEAFLYSLTYFSIA